MSIHFVLFTGAVPMLNVEFISGLTPNGVFPSVARL